MGGRRRARPPGGVPGHKMIFSLGSEGSTASVDVKVSAKAGFTNAAASPELSNARRSIFPPQSFHEASHPFPLAGKAYSPTMKRTLAFALLLLAAPAAAQDGPAYGPQLEG